jgi:hypothetical protein
VRYNGPIYHVFYHVLAAFPSIAFASNNSYGKDLDHDTITPREFWRSLEELHRNDFVLININDAITIGDNGVAARKPLYLPPGKKPLVISIDDINYYSRNLGRGTVDRLILDEQGRFASQTRMPNGTVNITYDNCVVPALEMFLAQYPDFSPFGARGMLAITGFDGILGYRTQSGSPNRDAEIAAVKPVVAALHAAGWYFASHSYGHAWMTRVSLEYFKTQEVDKWIDEVASIVGSTNIYVFPYGDNTYREHRNGGDPKFQYLLNRGFTIMCGVGMRTYNGFRAGYFFMDRANFDGFSLRNRRTHWMEEFGVDVDRVYYEPERLWGR